MCTVELDKGFIDARLLATRCLTHPLARAPAHTRKHAPDRLDESTSPFLHSRDTGINRFENDFNLCSLTRISGRVGPFAPTADSSKKFVGIDTLPFSKIELLSAKEGTQEQSENGPHILSLLFYCETSL